MRTSTTGKLNRHGFTLMELIVVIAIISLMLGMAVPATRDALTVDTLKKASRQIIGLTRELRANAVRDRVDYILVFNPADATYFVLTADMMPERIAEVQQTPRKLPSGVFIANLITPEGTQSAGEARLTFSRNQVSTPFVLHLAEDDNRMTIVVNPFLGVTAVYPREVDVPLDGGMGYDPSL